MKAIVQDGYGSPDALRFEDVDVPDVGDDEVLVRVRAASVNPYDWHMTTGVPYIARLAGGLPTPKVKVPGVDLAGQVEAVGKDVTRFQPGDEVFGMGRGAFAEYAVSRADKLAVKPVSVTYEQSAALPMAGRTALQGLRDKGRLQPGQRVLINGASGGTGTFAVQLAKKYGAEVTAVCSTRNVAAARSLGADHVIDYSRDDFTATGQRYDLILDIAGNRSTADRRRALTRDGIVVIVGGPKTNRLVGPMFALLTASLRTRFTRQRFFGMLTRNDRGDLVTLADLVAAGDVVPVIERTRPLPEAPEALRYVGAGHSRGKTIITI
jgi:NADPH:quinone reductase-like Zn-dependent oxidoreductase